MCSLIASSIQHSYSRNVVASVFSWRGQICTYGRLVWLLSLILHSVPWNYWHALLPHCWDCLDLVLLNFTMLFWPLSLWAARLLHLEIMKGCECVVSALMVNWLTAIVLMGAELLDHLWKLLQCFLSEMLISCCAFKAVLMMNWCVDAELIQILKVPFGSSGQLGRHDVTKEARMTLIASVMVTCYF